MPNPPSPLLDDAFARLESAASHAATSSHNSRRDPTLAQALAGNYAKARFVMHGLPLVLENVRNSVRTGTGEDGTQWENRLAAHYGEIAGTVGNDGDAVDVFVGLFPESLTVWVINQGTPTGALDEHKVMLGFATEAQARDAYLLSFDRGWAGLLSMVRCTVDQLKWWLTNGTMSLPFSQDQLPPAGSTMNKTLWNADAQPVATPLHKLMYDLRTEDVGGLMLDSVTMADLYGDPDIASMPVFDALVVEVARMTQKMNILQRTMDTAGGTITVPSYQISDPVKARGVLQVAVLFAMSDGQTITVWFHNPDTTPNKLMPMDELISWKWMLNKKDITIVVAPEKGKDLNIREVSRRIMRLVERNSAAFAKANGKLAERIAAETVLDTEIVELTGTLAALQTKIEVAKTGKADTFARSMRALQARQTDLDKLIDLTKPNATTENKAVRASLEEMFNSHDDVSDEMRTLRGEAVAGRESWESWNKLRAGDKANEWRGEAPGFDAARNMVFEWGTTTNTPDFTGIAYDYVARAFVMIEVVDGQRVLNYLLALTYSAALVECAALMSKRAAPPAAEVPPTPAVLDWHSKYTVLRWNGDRFRVFGVQNLNPISPSYPLEVEAEAGAAAFFAGGEFPAPSDANPLVKVLHTFPGDDGMEAQVVTRPDGKFTAVLIDTDSGYNVGLFVCLTEEQAIEKAKGMLGSVAAAPAPEPAAAAEVSPIEQVDAAYLFGNATDTFKVEVSASIGDDDYSPFATAKAMDEAAVSAGLSIGWSVGSAMLDGVEGAKAVLQVALETAENNAPINAADGNVDQAALEVQTAADIREALEVLNTAPVLDGADSGTDDKDGKEVAAADKDASEVKEEGKAEVPDSSDGPASDGGDEETNAEAEWEATPEDGDEKVLDGDFAGHPFRGNQYKQASHESGAAVSASMRAKHAERKGDKKSLAKAHKAAHYSHKAAAVSATGSARKYHATMASFHGKHGGASTLDSVTPVLDAAKADGMIIGKIKKGASIIGRAMIAADGKAMVYMGKAGTDRVTFASSVDGEQLRAMWSDDDAADMIGWLVAAVTPAEPPIDHDAEWTKMRDVDRGAKAFRAGFLPGSDKTKRIVGSSWADMGEVFKRKLIAAWDGSIAPPVVAVTAKQATEAYDRLSYLTNDAAGHSPLEFFRADLPGTLEPAMVAVRSLVDAGWPDGTVPPTGLLERTEQVLARWRAGQESGLSGDLGRGDARRYLSDGGLTEEQIDAAVATPTSVNNSGSIEVPQYTIEYLDAQIVASKTVAEAIPEVIPANTAPEPIVEPIVEQPAIEPTEPVVDPVAVDPAPDVALTVAEEPARDPADVASDPEGTLIADPADPLAAAVEVAPEVAPVLAVDPVTAADRAYLESLIDGSGDLLSEDTFPRLEPMFARYEIDPEMNALLERAAEVFGDAAVAAAKDALALPL